MHIATRLIGMLACVRTNAFGSRRPKLQQIQRMVKLKKLKEVLTPANGGEDDVTDEAWAEAAGETVETLRKALDDGARAKQEMGEPTMPLLLVLMLPLFFVLPT